MLDAAQTENRSDDQLYATKRNKLSIKVAIGSGTFILVAEDLNCLEQVFRALAKYCFSASGGISSDSKRLGELIDKNSFFSIQHGYEESDQSLVTDEIKSAAEEAIKYLQENVEELFAHAIQSMILEAAIKVMIGRAKKNFSKFKLAKNCAFKALKNNFAAAVKNRLKITNEARLEPYWSNAKKLELLEFYNTYHPMVKEAGKEYEAIKSFTQ